VDTFSFVLHWKYFVIISFLYLQSVVKAMRMVEKDLIPLADHHDHPDLLLLLADHQDHLDLLLLADHHDHLDLLRLAVHQNHPDHPPMNLKKNTEA
jgi:hypothetical protein